MGFLDRFGRGISRVIEQLFGEPEPHVNVPPPPPPPVGPTLPPSGPPDDDAFPEWNLPGSDSFEFDFSIAGFLPLDGDVKTDYVNTEGQAIDVHYDIDWPEADFVVVHVIEADGSDYYTTIVGNFDDYDDFLDHLQSWWEEGSP